MDKKDELKPYIEAFKQIRPPQFLREQILDSITNQTAAILPQLRVATALGVLLFLVTFSGYFTLQSNTSPLLSGLELEPNNFIESVLLSSNGLSAETAMTTLVDFE